MTALARTTDDFALTEAERAAYAANGYIVRERVFDANERKQILADSEALIAELSARRDFKRIRTGTFIFDSIPALDTTVKREREFLDEVRGLEPFAHLSSALNAWALDCRLTDPCKHACAADDIVLFTEKLNMKRARTGGIVELHQDFPYWAPFAPHAGRVATAMLYLDDAARGNGCLEVAPGSHRFGSLPKRTDAKGFDTLQMRQDYFSDAEMIAIEAPAGSVIFFGAHLAHRSAPNRSNEDRRAILFSYQPAGYAHQRDLIRADSERRRSAQGRSGSSAAASAH